MSYQFGGRDAYGHPHSIQNDRAIYEDFKARQQRMKEQFAGKGSNNNNSISNYDAHTGFERFKEANYDPHENRFNVFERKTQQQVPKTRDRFICNPLANLIQPNIKEKERVRNENYLHDKLDVSDIRGTKGNTYGKQKEIQGRNYMDITDIDKT